MRVYTYVNTYMHVRMHLYVSMEIGSDMETKINANAEEWTTNKKLE